MKAATAKAANNRAVATREMVDEIAVMEEVAALLEQRLNFAALQAKIASVMARRPPGQAGVRATTKSSFSTKAVKADVVSGARLRPGERSEVPPVVSPPHSPEILAKAGAGFIPRRGLELGTNPLFVADPPRQDSFGDMTSGAFANAMVRISKESTTLNKAVPSASSLPPSKASLLIIRPYSTAPADRFKLSTPVVRPPPVFGKRRAKRSKLPFFEPNPAKTPSTPRQPDAKGS